MSIDSRQGVVGLSTIFWSPVSRKISQGPKCTSQIWKCAVIGLRFLPLDSADISGAGMCDEPLGTSAWEATLLYG